jgi:Tol biopolymer transport system component
LNTDGSGLKQLTFGDEVYAGDSSPSQDSRSVVYTSVTPRRAILSKVPIDGGESQSVEGIKDGAYTPHSSPDGQYISFVDTSSFPQRLGLWRATDAALRFFDVVKAAQLHVGAIWTPDGKSLAYFADDGKTSNVWIQPIDGGPPRQLTDFTSGWIYRIAYAADGKRLYLARGFAVNDALLVRGFAE